MKRFCVFFFAALLFIGVMEGRAEESAAGSSSEVRIGVIAGLTGEYSAVFQNWVNGIRLAHETHQAEKRRPRVALFVEDDGFSAARGLAAYHKLIEINHVEALLNGSSATIGAISPLVVKLPFPVIQLGEETSEPRDDNILQIMPGNIESEEALGRHLAGVYPQGVVLFHTAHSTMQRFAAAFKRGYDRPLPAYELDPQMTDFKSLVAKAVSGRPSCVAILAFPPQGALLVKEVRRAVNHKVVFAFDGSFQTGFAEYQRLLEDVSVIDDGLVMTVVSETDPLFVDRYRKRFGREPGAMADIGFDAFNLLAAQYSPLPAQWTAKIKSSEIRGVSGAISFDSAGVRKPQFRLLGIRDFRLGNRRLPDGK